MQPSKKFSDLVKLVSILRSECPWDKKQTHQSIKDHLIEECYEALEALDNKDMEDFCKELGDVLLQVVFHANLANEKNYFDIDDVIYKLMDKLIYRHPHVFQKEIENSHTQAKKNWEHAKREEGRKSLLDGIPQNLPSLITSHRIQEKINFYESKTQEPISNTIDKIDDVWEKVKNEINDNSNSNVLNSLFGEWLFNIVTLIQKNKCSAEDVLRQFNNTYKKNYTTNTK